MAIVRREMWVPTLCAEQDGARLLIKLCGWKREYVTSLTMTDQYVGIGSMVADKANAVNFAGSSGSAATHVQFTTAVRIGSLLTLGSFTRDIAVAGVLATDRLNLMPLADLPGGVDLISARPIADNTVRLRLRGFSLLTDNSDYPVALTALR